MKEALIVLYDDTIAIMTTLTLISWETSMIADGMTVLADRQEQFCN